MFQRLARAVGIHASVQSFLILVSGAGRKSAQDELLYEGVNRPDASGDEEALEHQPWSSIGLWIVDVRNGARDQVATQA